MDGATFVSLAAMYRPKLDDVVLRRVESTSSPLFMQYPTALALMGLEFKVSSNLFNCKYEKQGCAPCFTLWEQSSQTALNHSALVSIEADGCIAIQPWRRV